MRTVSASAFLVSLWLVAAVAADETLLVIEVDAVDRYERTDVANTGVSFLAVEKDRCLVLGTARDLQEILALGYKADIVEPVKTFPPADAAYHDFAETVAELQQTAADHPDIATLAVLGSSVQGRSLWGIKVSDNPGLSEGEPGVFLVALHHAREHLSTEVVLGILKTLTDEYATNLTVRALVDENEIWLVPMLNPDGGEYDIEGGSYHMWRKNRRDNGDGTYGVDLNRNYSQFWGGPGSSGYTGDETYRGPSAFSEPETQAVRNFFASHAISVAITYHSYGELVMYPNHGSYDPLDDPMDEQVFEIMAAHMADLTGYTDQPGHDLYLSSGETCDWAYYTHGTFAFTIELPTDTFYPGAEIIPEVVAENVAAALYLIDLADDPYRVIGTEPLDVSPDSVTLEVGETQQFDARGGTPPYTFTSTNTTVATIDQTGLLLAKAVGTCQVRVEDAAGTVASTGTITVKKAGICGLAGGADAAALLSLLTALVALRARRRA